MKKVIVLGAGMVGSAIAKDLSSNYEVTSADINENNLNSLKKKNIKTIKTDLSSESSIKKIVKDFDLVIGAVPGFMGYSVLATVIKSGKNIVDISFFGEDAFKLNKYAKEHNVTAIVDCGVAPGLSNIILGYHNKRMTINNFECYVGGLPKKRNWPFEYKAPFSPIDVIEEYTRPARIVENGKVITKPALSEEELISIEPVGTLEAFNTDGLRSLLRTMKIPNMKEKTLRYPGHIEFMKILREAGFFKGEKINVNGSMVSPLELTAQLLFPIWKLEPDEKEFTVLKIKIEGKEGNKNKTYKYSLYDEFDESTGISSMARTTGYTCSAAADLVLKNKFKRRGISPPEFLGENEENFRHIIKYLEERNIKLT